MSRILLPRRALLGGMVTLPLLPLAPLLPLGCARRPAEAPLAHLYGKEWVHGSYELYAGKYAGVQTAAKDSTEDAYKVLAQKGVAALDGLQARDVPFFMRVDSDGDGRCLWNVRNEQGSRVASGVYIYLITSGGSVKSGKISIIR